MGKIFASVVIFSVVSQAWAGATISNFADIRRSLGLSRLTDRVQDGRTVRVAILDKAFTGVRAEFGRTLPANTRYVPGKVAAPDDLNSDHGVRMAQMVSALVTEDLRHPRRLDLRLYNAFGFTNFRDAIRDAIQQRVDIILYSEVWEYGGNLDGRGFVNAEVDRAVKAGILWVNAAGNFGRTTYNGRIQKGEDSWVRLPDQNRALKLVCRAKSGGGCPAKIVLSWNDFKDDSEEGTDKDLDLALTDDLLNVVQSSSLKQSNDRNETRAGYSKYPREIVGAELKPGTYYLRVKDASGNFGDRDRLRITADGENLEMPSAQTNESLLVPADNPNVLTVGASDSDRSGASARLGKPDLLAVSAVKLSDGNEFRGSSNSAAFTAAVAALIKLSGERPTRALMMERAFAFNWDRGLLSLNLLRFAPAGGGCFADAPQTPNLPSYVSNVLAAGGRLVQTTAGLRIMTAVDPLRLFPDLRRQRLDDMILVTPQGPMIAARGGFVPQGAVEVFARPFEAGLCRRPSPAAGRLLGF